MWNVSLPSSRFCLASLCFTVVLVHATLTFLRIILVLFAIWVLAIEPTFRAFEQIEEQCPKQERRGGENDTNLDQPVPPREVVPPRWVNDHLRDITALPLFDPLYLLQLLNRPPRDVSPLLISADLCLPFPPPALPLRL
jgi:hypothetical protein